MLTRSSTNSGNSTNSGSSSGSHSTSSNEQGVIVPFAPRRTRSASNANANDNANVAKSNGLVLSTNLRLRTSSSLSAAAASAGAASDETPKKKRKTKNKKENNDGLIFPAYQPTDMSLNNLNDKVLARTEDRRAIVKEDQKSTNVRFGYSSIVIVKEEDCSHVVFT